MRLSIADVTVVVPAWNAAPTIAGTLRSLQTQTAGHPAVIVVDDGSTDRTAEIALGTGSSVTVLHSARNGPGGARNVGIAAATTSLVAFSDADDRWPPDRLAGDLELFNSTPLVELVLGRTRHDAADATLLAGVNLDDDRAGTIPSFGAATMRREVFDRIGRIREEGASYEDYDWFLRAREHGVQIVVHDRIASWRLVHSASTSRQNPGSHSDLLGVLHDSLARRRAEGTVSDALPQLSELRTCSEPGR